MHNFSQEPVNKDVWDGIYFSGAGGAGEIYGKWR